MSEIKVVAVLVLLGCCIGIGFWQGPHSPTVRPRSSDLVQPEGAGVGAAGGQADVTSKTPSADPAKKTVHRAKRRIKADPDGDHAYLDWLDKLTSLTLKVERSQQLRQLYQQRIKEVKEAEDRMLTIEYDCKLEPSTSEPLSVHELRPGDIDVVAAFGDSITAGNGCEAENLVEMAIENRGESWSIGGSNSLEEGFVTIPNILRTFKKEPRARGFSSCASTRDMKLSWLNVAQPGAKCIHMPGQADMLIKRLREDERIDFEEDWKLVTLFIGGNDLCVYCGNEDQFNPVAYREKIEEAIDKLHAEVPKVLVNLVTMFDLTPMKNLSTNLLCQIMQMAYCECALNDTYRETLRGVQRGYYTELLDLVSSGKYDTRDDFTVVLQPHMTEVKPFWDYERDEWDTSYLAVDCFHPNRKGHRGLAYILWNTMLYPVGQKPIEYPMVEDIEKDLDLCCPSETYPYIFTNKNSIGAPILPIAPLQQCWNPVSKTDTKRPTGKARTFDHPMDQVDYPKAEKKIAEETIQEVDEERGINTTIVVTLSVVCGTCFIALVLTLTYAKWKKFALALKMKIIGRKVDEGPMVKDDTCNETEPANQI